MAEVWNWQPRGTSSRFRPVGRLTAAELDHLRQHKPEILRHLRSEEFETSLMPPTDADTANEFYWLKLSEDDRAYLVDPHVFPSACPWCGGRYRHNPLCDDLQRSWEPARRMDPPS